LWYGNRAAARYLYRVFHTKVIMRFARVIMILLLAALSFGGSFTCSGSSHDDEPPVTGK
jgi:hypothetical protein